MLAGVLFRFGVEAFGALQLDPVFAGSMIAIYVLARSFAPRFAVPLLLVYGLCFAFATDSFDLSAWTGAGIASPVFVMPSFDVPVLISIGIPLYLVTMSSQNMAGVAVLRSAGYRAPVSSALNVTGILTTVLAPFGGFAFNLAAITAAICANEEAGKDPKARYWAPVYSGLMYFVLAIFGAAVIGLFLAAPKVFVAVLAGLALLPTIAASLSGALATPAHREAALITFLVTVSGISFAGIASPVWGLVFGAIAYGLSASRKSQ
jgi:benzoate membrane transport protein